MRIEFYSERLIGCSAPFRLSMCRHNVSLRKYRTCLANSQTMTRNNPMKKLVLTDPRIGSLKASFLLLMLLAFTGVANAISCEDLPDGCDDWPPININVGFGGSGGGIGAPGGIGFIPTATWCQHNPETCQLQDLSLFCSVFTGASACPPP
jgi:hypothetical protein